MRTEYPIQFEELAINREESKFLHKCYIELETISGTWVEACAASLGRVPFSSDKEIMGFEVIKNTRKLVRLIDEMLKSKLYELATETTEYYLKGKLLDVSIDCFCEEEAKIIESADCKIITTTVSNYFLTGKWRKPKRLERD